MPELKHGFQSGRMNKDLDERLVPNGEYRDALNVEVSNSNDSDVGSLQTTMGNTLPPIPAMPTGGQCVGSIVDEKNDKLYYLVSAPNIDFIAEYDQANNNTLPVCVDVHNNGPNRVLKFNPNFPITGINIIDGLLFWTDNATEPKRINIQRGKDGSNGFLTHTLLQVRDTTSGSAVTTYVNGPPIREEHLTVIRKSPPAAPVLEMNDTLIGDLNFDGVIGLIDGVVQMTDPVTGDGINPFVDAAMGGLATNPVSITFNGPDFPDFSTGDYLIASVVDDPKKKVRVLITAGGGSTFTVEVQSGTSDVTTGDVVWDVTLEQIDPLFQFKFPRFAYRYKYEDGEYSTFSPFTEVGFLPGDFYYLPREGYNLGMVNNLRQLAIKDFVHDRLVPDDVIAIDILYKESNSPNIYSIKTVKRIDPTADWDAWNADSASSVVSSGTRGYLPIKSEMIHAVLPSNQLLRPWDNVPRRALAQEITKNRLVYGNYLQNYDLYSLDPLENNINVKVGIINRSQEITGNITPEQYDPAESYDYRISKSVKSLRTYQVGVAYIDQYGRETPVFSSDKQGSTGATDHTSKTSIYLDKSSAVKQNKLGAHVMSTAPDWAKSFKFYIKETSNEYYNLAMDRWYDAEDGNIWLSFPSSERNKVDIETFLILKKEHDADIFVDEPARYKILAIENEAPPFVKTEPQALGVFQDTPTGDNIGVLNGGGTGWPFVGDNSFMLNKPAMDATGWSTTASPYTGNVMGTDLSNVWFRFRGAITYSKWYALSSISFITGGYYELKSQTTFGPDMGLTSTDGTYTNRAGNLAIEMVRRQEVNKPEFEGRFFVKILKDHTIKQRVIGAQGSGSYIITTTAMSTYINPEPNATPDAFHGGPDSNAGVPAHANNWFGYNPNDISRSNDFGTGWGRPSGAINGQGNSYWAQAGNTTSNSGAPGFFIDKIEGFRPYKNMIDKYWSNTDNSWRTNPQNPNVPCWLGGATLAGLSAGYPDPMPDDQRGTQAIGTGTTTTAASTWNYLNNGGNLAGPRKPGFSDLFGSTGLGGEIAPSIGIDQQSGSDGNIIHLSYTGITDITNASLGGNAPTSTNGFAWHDFSKDMVKHTNDLMFINEITTPGTVWRWKEDPGQVIYQTKVPATSNSSTPQTTAEWAKNTRDTQIAVGEPGVTLFNFARMTDYARVTHHSVTGFLFGVQVCTNVSPGYVTTDQGNHSGGAGICCESGFGHSSVGGWFFAPGSGSAHGGSRQNRFPTYIPSWKDHRNIRRRFQFKAEPLFNPGGKVGGEAPHFYTPVNDPNLPAHFDSTGTALTGSSTPVLPATKAPGIRNDGMHSGYGGTSTTAPLVPFNAATEPLGNTEIPNIKQWNAGGTQQSTIPGSVTWEILEPYAGDDTKYSSNNPAVWETEPKEDVGLDIYYEVGQIYPVELNNDTIEQFVGAVNTNLRTNSSVKCLDTTFATVGLDTGLGLDATNIRVLDVSNNSVQLGDVNGNPLILTSPTIPAIDDVLIFRRADGSTTEAYVKAVNAGGWYELWENVDKNLAILPWHNCYSFGNGVESDRVRDDFNQVTIDNGPIASTTLEEPYSRERRSSGLIYSGIYNSTSGINNLNQFIQAEKITKDLNPTYGSIQKLHTRNTDLLTLCEDKVLKVLANKDALYNADGNMNLTATANVLGQTIPLAGEFGISKDPQSFASESYRAYFSDRSRGVILRLSQDGLTPISDYGMKDWFADNLPLADKIIGSFDDRKQTYNVTLTGGYNPANGSIGDDYTISFTENVKGWPSFKSFIQEDGLSLNNTYYTLFEGKLWEHHSNQIRNNYYGTQYDSHVDILFNDNPGSVKGFQTLNYEGTQARITADIDNNLDYYDNFNKYGWYVKKIMTILHQGSFATYGNWVDQDEFLDDRLDLGAAIGESGKNTGLEFWDKEGKWFSQIKGIATEWLPDGRAGNIDTQEFSYQGIGNAEGISCPYGCDTSWECIETLVSNNSCEDRGLTQVIPPTPFMFEEDFVQHVSNTNYGLTNVSAQSLYSCVSVPNTLQALISGQSGYQIVMDSLCTSIYNDWITQGSNMYDANATYYPGRVVAYVDSTYGIINYFVASSASGALTGSSSQNPQQYPAPMSVNVGTSNYWEGCSIATDAAAATSRFCECNNGGYMIVHPKLGFTGRSSIGNYTAGAANYTTWDNFITTLINDWGNWATACPLVPGMNFIQFKSAVSTWALTSNAKYEIIWGEADYCLCTEEPECECVELPGTQHHPTQLDCENAQNCCGTTGASPCLYCGDPNADTSVPGCCDNTQQNYNPLATCDDGTCIPIIYGCMDDGTDPNYPGRPVGYVGPALNYYSAATVDNGTCVYAVYGCTDPLASNYDPNANVDDGSCVYPPSTSCGPWVLGTDYNVTTTDDTGTCASPNNDGSLGWSVSIPNFVTGDSWTWEVLDPNNNPVFPFGYPINVQNGGTGSAALAPGAYLITITHTIALGGTCVYTMTANIGCN